MKIHDSVALSPEADILWNVCVHHAVPFYKLFSSLFSLFDLRRASSIAGTATSYVQSTFVEAY